MIALTPRLAPLALALLTPLPLTQCGSLRLAKNEAPAPSRSDYYEPPVLDPQPAATAVPDFHPQTVAYVPGSSGAPAAPLAHGGPTSRGIGSFYRVRTNGTRTASGIPLKDSVSTAAHRTLPFGTLVRVTNLKNGRSEIVKITDRGPFIKGRIIDVSLNAAENLGMVSSGIVPVEIQVLGRPGSV
ncbi:MAG: septal ring lytic transglycosylase RlpA family protein [Verrucomicrobiales bacterium]|nr:septal ring lytic transglycosylase RlpA family protein [Verrucomicrobiales bacterium]